MTTDMPVPTESPRVTLVGRPGCHLCDDARAVVQRVASDLGIEWQERSIDAEPDLRARFAEEIPVVLVDGVPHSFWHVDEQRLRAALTEPAGSAGRRWLRRRHIAQP